MFECSKAIWVDEKFEKDCFAEFVCEYIYVAGKVKIAVFADSDYILYVNGKMVSFGQYQGYEGLNYYDIVDLTKYLKNGKNIISFEVWRYGQPNFSHVDVKGGLIFEIDCDGKTVAVSDKKVKARKSRVYLSGSSKYITTQLGYTYSYNSVNEDDWKLGKNIESFTSSYELNFKSTFVKRPNKKLIKRPRVNGKLIKKDDYKRLYDLTSETVGYLYLDVECEEPTELKVYFGEHIVDGWVRGIFSNGRDYSVTYIAKAGRNKFIGLFRRLGCRYLEIHSDLAVKVNQIGIVPYEYPLIVKKFDFGDELTNKIYSVCIKTVQSCMHEHYEDCPWREQALYTMDSRNQMLCSYYIFENPKQFIKSNLALIANGQREDGVLNICFPCSEKLYIPSFVLHYATQVYEYLQFTNDKKFVKSLLPSVEKALEHYVSNLKNGLIEIDKNLDAWHFYEWQSGYDMCGKHDTDIIINCLTVIALKNYEKIAKILRVKNKYEGLATKLAKNIAINFFDRKRQLFSMYKVDVEERLFSELSNSLAILSGSTDYLEKSSVENICKVLKSTNETITKCTLSMTCFKYDALLMLDLEGNKKFVLDDIYKNYSFMLSQGATTFWETIKGESDFDGHASLCHGWSAIPIYYFNLLLENSFKDR